MAITEAMRLRRPRLLIRAARIGAAQYRRDRDLAAALPGVGGASARGPKLVAALVDAERACEAERATGRPSYSTARHVQILTALLCEAAELARGAAGANKATSQPKASGSAALRSAT